jgi:small subunit ribosomal protein S8
MEVPLFHPTPKFCLKILDLLQKEGFIRGWKKIIVNDKEVIFVLLKYTEFSNPVIKKIYCVSKPGKRVFSKSKSFWKVYNGKGLFLISTSKGLLTDMEARLNNVGGEIICYVE